MKSKFPFRIRPGVNKTAVSQAQKMKQSKVLHKSEKWETTNHISFISNQNNLSCESIDSREIALDLW